MSRGLAIIVFLSAAPVFGSNVQLLFSLPSGAVSKSIHFDAAGNIYVAGFVTPQSPKSQNDTRDAFVAKLSLDGSKLLYFTVVKGSLDDAANALELGSDGSAYVIGSTVSPDFPVTAGSLQPTFGAPQNGSQGFLAKLDANGALVYATFLGGTVSTAATGIALDSAGDVFVTGSGGSGFPSTSGSPAGGPGGFVLKLDATLSKVLLSINGYGGGLVGLDPGGNIYLAGAAPAGAATGFGLPPLPAGAFQSTHTSQFCVQTSGPSGFALDCSYQYVAKIDPTGTKLLWATYVTGTYGATAEGMAVDNRGNVILAGTTNSDDYPVTPDAFQTAYAPAAAPQPNFGFPQLRAPSATGYVTKLNATGTGLVWSTYFGGSYADHITGMTVSATGDIYLSGRAGSSDLPGLSATPSGCRPSANQVLGFVARMSADGATASESQLIYGAPACLYSSCGSTVNGFAFTGWPMALRPDGRAVVGGVNGALASVDFTASSHVSCITDPADNAQLSSVAPGQLVTVFGTDLAPAAPYMPTGGVAQSSDTFGVYFNGLAGPLLYSSADQINVQVPYQIVGQISVQMQVISKVISAPVSETRTLGVVERQPSVFLSAALLESSFPGFSVCANTVSIGLAAVAVNGDGTLNDCANPAIAGSTVTIFVNGLGPVNPAQTTGAIATGPPVAISPAIDVNASFQGSVLATSTLPGTIAGVAQVQLRLPSKVGNAQTVMPMLAGSPLREQPILIWTRAN